MVGFFGWMWSKFFFPKFFKSFLGQKHWESLWKKIQLILQFFWGRIHQKKLLPKKILICVFK
jgi:hypothetical protein